MFQILISNKNIIYLLLKKKKKTIEVLFDVKIITKR